MHPVDSRARARASPYWGRRDGGGHMVVWVSLDPRSGELSVYPSPVARRLEVEAHRRASEVRFSGFGGHWETLIVELHGEVPVQRTAQGGRRDVRRLQVPIGAQETEVIALKTPRGWRIADHEVLGSTAVRTAAIAGHGLEPGTGNPAGSSTAGAAAAVAGASGSAAFPAVPVRALRTASKPWCADRVSAIAPSFEEEEAAGLVGLWEWCREAEPKNLRDVPPEMWGVYSEEQNEELERAYRAGEPSTKLNVGIRDFEITFESQNRAKQADTTLKKRRHVRRRAVHPDERDMALVTNEVHDVEFAEGDECAVCCSSFAETPTLPIVRTGECGHVFHGVCVQQLADSRGACPLCRGSVDWLEAFARSLQSRPPDSGLLSRSVHAGA